IEPQNFAMKRLFLASYLTLFLLSQHLPAQFGTGVILNDSSYQKLPAQPDYGEKGGGDTILKVDLKPFCPPVGNQGFNNTCTGWATGYAAHTIQQAIQKGWNDREILSKNAYSALFIYNQIKKGTLCEEGTYIQDAMELLRTSGNVPASDFDRGDCDAKPTGEQLLLAKQHRIKEFRRLFNVDDAPGKKIAAVRRSLADGKPVVICLKIKQGFFRQNGSKWWLPKLDDSPPTALAHAMVVVGYDDSKGSGGAVQLMNSWGTGWGEGGFIWMSYADFADDCAYAFQFSLLENPGEVHAYTARIACRTVEFEPDGGVAFDEEGKVKFSDAKPRLRDGIYEFDRNWRVGDAFQLQVSGVLEELYLYAFSFDNEGKITVHFPRDARLDERFEGKNESAVITSSAVRLALPDAERAILLEKPGTEFICLLFSPTPVEDFNRRLEQLKINKLSFDQRLRQAFGKQMFAAGSVAYFPQEIGFTVKPAAGQRIVAVVMRLKVD
ncbi:MAG: C1 family peptidase, partial [Bacteroidota bacterium]